MSTEERAEWRGDTEEPDTVTVLVDGRAAIPVRAIPLFTRWRMSPDELAAQLARSRPTAKLRNTHAYHLANAKPVRVRAVEWEPVVCRLEALEARIRRERPYEQSSQDEPEGLTEWIRESVVSLPDGVFVWHDEFVRDFVSDCHRLMPPEEIESLRREAAADGTHYLLSYAPLELSQARVHVVVFEGFQHPVSSEPETGEADQQRRGELHAPVRWRLRPPTRADDLRRALHAHLGAADKTAEPPTASDVLAAWMANRPSGVSRVTANEVEYLDGPGKPKGVSLDALAERIARCIERVDSTDGTIAAR